MEIWKYGRKEILEIVGYLVKRNNLKTPFKNGYSGEDWFLRFCDLYKLSMQIRICKKKMSRPIYNQQLLYYFDTLDKFELHDKPV